VCAICQPLNSPPGDLVANFDIALRSSLNPNTHGTYMYMVYLHVFWQISQVNRGLMDGWRWWGAPQIQIPSPILFSPNKDCNPLWGNVCCFFLFVVEGLRASYWKSWRRWIQPKQSPKTDIFFWNDRRHDFESPLALKIQSYYSPGLPLGLADRGFVIQRKNMRALQDPCFFLFF
jgi:hypothetical protein